MTKATFIYHQDPGHGWLQVPVRYLDDLGIVRKITVFSYLNGSTVYLEEDCDMPTFIEAWKVRYPEIELDIIENNINVDSSIRNWRPYPALKSASWRAAS